jgi:anti-sigma B factor antagonist
MRLVIEEVAGITVVTPPGDDLDASVAADFKEAFAPILTGRKRLVLDLAQLKFVDSSGLGAILTSYRSSKAAGSDLVLCGMRPAVKSLFELVNADRFCPIVATQEDALRSLKADHAGNSRIRKS